MKIPQSELNAPGVLCRTVGGTNYQVTYNIAKDKFTLWKLGADGADKLLTAASIDKCYAAIPWR